jgi:lysophospholipid acyltransferase (LPLAT)-like uncharacterized protein
MESYYKLYNMKQKLKEFVTLNIIPFLIYLITRFIYLTNKKIFHFPTNIPTDPIIIAVWHGRAIMQPYSYKKLRPNHKLKSIISEHKDGKAIAKLFSYFKIGTINGSSTRGGVKALIGAIRELKNDTDISITPDGPKGPLYSVADGIVAISQKSGAKIIPLEIEATKYWELNTWDKYFIPKPFGTIQFFAGTPFDVNGLEMDAAKKLIQNNLMSTSKEIL